MNRIYFLAILVLLHICQGDSTTLKVGGIFHSGEQHYYNAFVTAIENLKKDRLTTFELEASIVWINTTSDSFKTSTEVCNLVKEGVTGIFAPTQFQTREVVLSICSKLEIPVIEYAYHPREELKDQKTVLNFYPDNKYISKAIADVLKSLSWKSFTVIYDTDDALIRIQDVLQLHGPLDSPITIRHISEDQDFLPLLKEISNSTDWNLLLDLSPTNLEKVLFEGKKFGMLKDYYKYLICYLDVKMLPIFDVLNGTYVNITGFQMLQHEKLPPEISTIEETIIHDAVQHFKEALYVLSTKDVKIQPKPLFCNRKEKYHAGVDIATLLRELSKADGLAGELHFDKEGRRLLYLSVLSFQHHEYVITHKWNVDDGLQIIKAADAVKSFTDTIFASKTFIVSTKLGAPYMMEVKDASSGENQVIIGNKRYEGYCVDLMFKIGQLLKFKHTFELVKDNNYGSYDPVKKTWNGLVKRILDRKADFAICDLTITFDRKKAVDFTMPFMTLGISILFSHPEDKEPNLFSFLSPLSTDVWMYMATAYLAVSLMLFFQARMAPGEWNNPHPCNMEADELENNFNLMNSMWLTMGSLMQQGSDILPQAPSIRMVAGMWWFFVLIMVSSYTANLAAFLTADKIDVSINSAEDLAKQTKIKYGALQGGSTSSFFQHSNHSTYQRMWTAMSDAKPSVFTESNDEGVERVRTGKRGFAFLMESTSIEYTIQKYCGLTQVGGLLDSKGYGIAMPLNSPYRTAVSGAVLKLQESGELGQLKEHWWKKVESDPSCTVNRGSSGGADADALKMSNVGGVFLVLMCGCGVSFLIALCEFIWNVRKVAVEEKVTPWKALIVELKFAVNIWTESKPVKITQKSCSTSSEENDGFKRATSTARSLMGSFLRIDVIDKLDKENMSYEKKNCNRSIK